MSAPTTKAPKTQQPNSVADQWREVQEAQKKRDRALAEIHLAVARYGTAETELGLATDRFNQKMAVTRETPATPKP